MNQNANAAVRKPFSWSVLLASVLATLAVAGLVGAAFFWASQPAQSLDPNVREQAVGWWIVLAVALLAVAVGIYILPPEHAKKLSSDFQVILALSSGFRRTRHWQSSLPADSSS